MLSAEAVLLSKWKAAMHALQRELRLTALFNLGVRCIFTLVYLHCWYFIALALLVPCSPISISQKKSNCP